ncbi:Cytochrome P450 monooxygenase [Pseudocercospora fuligena]|uniref:Cytochrome P450 monooxygenase n=1 Tax=Pseudocercospora fuligena TaxID=685502 RepID=A0A8H6RT41_9PEZI|nr:Cytochrome P450 monooxygenase [Pseudocercospora fuligena]
MSVLLLGNLSTPLSIALLALVSYSVVHTYIRSRRLAHVPGPWYTKYTILPLLTWTYRGTSWQLFGYLCKTHGPLIRVAPNQLITGSVTQYKKMYSARPQQGYPRSDWFTAMRLKPGFDNTLSMRDEVQHTKMRSKLSYGYSGKENPNLEKVIDEQVLNFVALIETKYVSEPTKNISKPLDFAHKAFYFTLNVISALAFSESFGNLAADDDRLGYIQQVESSIGVLNTLALMPWLFNFMEKVQITKWLNREDMGLGMTFKLAAKAVDQHFSTTKVEGRKDMLTSFLNHGLTRSELESEAVLQILAGSDTTATAVRSVVLHVVSNPHIHQKLVQEIDSHHTEYEGIISDARARKLPYLQACIKEGLRIWPPVSGLTSHEVPAGGDMIDGYFVPAGTRIGWSTHAILHNPTIFSPNADTFRPERWILATEGGDCDYLKLLQTMERSLEVVFSYGRYKCLGQNVALMELNKVVVELFKRFDWEFCDPLRLMEVNYQAGIWVQSGMWMRAVRRQGPINHTE